MNKEYKGNLEFPGINAQEFTIKLDKRYWNSEDQFNQNYETYKVVRKKLPRKLKKYYKKMGVIFIDKNAMVLIVKSHER